MATPFENFIQVEIPKRPYLDADVPAESVIVRRGAGPRQLNGVQLTNGQVLGMVNDELVGVSQTQVNFVSTAFETPDTTWTITHGRNNREAVCVLRDSSNNEIQPDNIQYNPNTVVITFAVAQSGNATVVFLG